MKGEPKNIEIVKLIFGHFSRISINYILFKPGRWILCNYYYISEIYFVRYLLYINYHVLESYQGPLVLTKDIILQMAWDF